MQKYKMLSVWVLLQNVEGKKTLLEGPNIKQEINLSHLSVNQPSPMGFKPGEGCQRTFSEAV